MARLTRAGRSAGASARSSRPSATAWRRPAPRASPASKASPGPTRSPTAGTALVRRCWEQIREVNCDRLFRRGLAIARCEDMLELARAKGDVAGEAKVQDLLCRLTGAYSPPRIRIDEPPD